MRSPKDQHQPFVQSTRFIVPSAPRQKRVPKPEKEPRIHTDRSHHERAAALHQAMQENEETISRGRKHLEEIFGRGDISPKEALREAHRRARDNEREVRLKRERFNRKGTEKVAVSIPTGLTPPPSAIVGRRRELQKLKDKEQAKRKRHKDSSSDGDDSVVEGGDLFPRRYGMFLPEIETKRKPKQDSTKDIRRPLRPTKLPKSARRKELVLGDEFNLPTLQPEDDAAGYLAERISLLRADEEKRKLFVQRCNERLRERKKIQDQRWSGIDGALNRYIEARGVGNETFFREQAQRHNRHAEYTRLNHMDVELTKRDVVLEKFQVHASRQEKANVDRAKFLARAKLANEWVRIVLTTKAFIIMKRHADAKRALMKQMWPAFLVVAAAAHWRDMTKRRKKDRELVANTSYLVRHKLPEHLERARQKRFGPPIDLIGKFLKDSHNVQGFARVVSKHMKAIRKVQTWIRNHLASRALWRNAILVAWEKYLGVAAMRSYAEVYPMEHVAESSFLRRNKSSAIIPKGVKSSSMLKAIVVELREQGELHREAIDTFGPSRIKPGQLIPVHRHLGELKPLRSQTILTFVPHSFRTRVVRMLVKKAAAQHTRRLLSHERRLQQALQKEGFIEETVLEVKPRHLAASAHAAIFGQRLKLKAKEQAERKEAFVRRFLRDDPRPVLESFVDVRTIGRLVQLVETHCLQHQIKRELQRINQQGLNGVDLSLLESLHHQHRAKEAEDRTFITAARFEGSPLHQDDSLGATATADPDGSITFASGIFRADQHPSHEPFPDSPLTDEAKVASRAIEAFLGGHYYALETASASSFDDLPVSPNRQRNDEVRLRRSQQEQVGEAADVGEGSNFDVALEFNSVDNLDVSALAHILNAEFMQAVNLPDDLSFIQAFVEGY